MTHICFNYTYFIKCVTLLLILDLTCVYLNICLIIKVNRLHFITLLPPRIHLLKKKISGIMFHLILVYTACSLYFTRTNREQKQVIRHLSICSTFTRVRLVFSLYFSQSSGFISSPAGQTYWRNSPLMIPLHVIHHVRVLCCVFLSFAHVPINNLIFYPN